MTPIKTMDRTSALHDLPIWARAVAYVGIPGVIAMYLVYHLATSLPAKLDAHAQETRSGIAQQIQLLQRICANTAGTPEERASCWAVRP